MRQEIEAIMLFVAELTGSFVSGSGTKEDKIKCGEQDYITNNLHELDLSAEEGKKDLHENMWLERLYGELDEYFEIESIRSLRALSLAAGVYRESGYKYQVPLELDASASLLQIMGILLNDKRLMEMTNVIGETLEDPWYVKGLSRAKLKCVMTPKLYGSSQTAKDLWKKAKLKFTAKDIKIVTEELSNGAFGLANQFKDFIIHSCKPKPTMEIVIGDDAFGISCNKFRNVGDKTKAYKIWDSNDNTYNMVLHTDTHKVADLEQFRLYMVTLLVHNVDSQIMDAISDKVMAKYGWAVPIHDAILCSPAAATDVRIWYNEELAKLHANRKQILQGFFKSVGIDSTSNAQWEALKAKIVEFEGNFEECLSMPLK